MIIAGIIFGILAFLIVAAFVGDGLHNSNAGVFPGLVAATWAGWPFFHHHFVGRSNFLHPEARGYSVDLPTAFSTIREILRETVYDFGDRWHVVTADPASGRIVADLCYVDEQQRFDQSGKFDFRSRTDRFRRRIRLQVHIEPQGSHASVVQLEFSTQIEGANRSACDPIITDLSDCVRERLGPSDPVGFHSSTGLPTPPWWLIITSACSILVLFKDACEVVF